MQDLTPRLVTILRKYMRDPAAHVVNATTLSELEIDLLDLPMILLDAEDGFDIQIAYDEQAQTFATVDDLAVCVAACLDAQALRSSLRAGQPRRQCCVPRSTGNWLSTGSERPHRR